MKQKSQSWFNIFSRWAARAAGSPVASIGALLIIIVWGITGPIFGFSDTWQLVINTGTSVATFLMVFLIQATQNRESAAVQVKLSELIRALDGAQTSMANLEELDEAGLEALQDHYSRLAEQAKNHSDKRKTPRKKKS